MSEQLQPGEIVVAVDGSEHADRATKWAAEQAELEDRPLVAVSVAEWDRVSPPRTWASSEEGAAVRDAMLAAARAVAEDAVTSVRDERPAVRVRSLALPGDPRATLVDLSRDAHLLVLGSRGRGALRTMLLGSVSSGVAEHALCPVVVCRPQSKESAGRGVVVGADGTAESLPVIEFAFAQASLRGLPLTVLHAYWDAVAAVAGLRGATDRVDRRDVEDLRAVLSQSVAGFSEKYPDVQVSLQLEHGLVDEALAARGQGRDLVVVGRHPMDSVGRMLTGSIASAVLERARSTVAIVPEAGAGDG